MLEGEVPFTAPGTSNVMMVVFRSLAFAERTNPDVIRLTANTCRSALPVAIPSNDRLFVLLFMMFSDRRSDPPFLTLK
jgi:hypothetical protein